MRVVIQSTDTMLFEGDAEEVLLPTTAGGIGVRGGHTPLIPSLKPGENVVITKDTQKKIPITYGTAEVGANSVLVFLESEI